MAAHFQGKIKSDPEMNSIFQKVNDCLILTEFLSSNGKDIEDYQLPASKKAKEEFMTKNHSSSYAQLALETHQNQITAQEKLLGEKRQELDLAFEEKIKAIDSYHTSLSELSSTQESKKSAEEIHCLLVDSGKILAEQQLKWSQFGRFFMEISNQITAAAQGPLQSWMKETAIIGAASPEEQAMSMVGFLIDSVKRAQLTLSFVQHVSNTYFELSQKFLLPSVTRLPVLLALVKGTDHHLLQLEKSTVMNQCREATKQLRTKVVEAKSSMMRAIEKREEDYRKIGKLLPPPPASLVQRVNAIQELKNQDML
jgi:hypothetical protein